MIELFDSRHLKFKKYFGIIFLVILALLLSLIFWGLILSPKVVASSPEASTTNGSLKKIEIKFNKPVNRSKISTYIEPNVQGSWVWEDQLFGSHLFTKLVFNPDQYLYPKQNYLVKISGVSSILHYKPENNYTFDFTTQSLPEIQSASVSENQDGVPIDSPLLVQLDQSNEGLVDYEFVFSPEAKFEKTYDSNSKQYSLAFTAPLAQATQYTLSAKRYFIDGDIKDNEIKDDFTVSFITKGPPAIKSYYPSGDNILVDVSELKVTLDQPVNSKQLIDNTSINPLVVGKWSWDSNHNALTYSLSEKLKYGTKYNINIKKGVTGSGNFLAEDVNLPFTTIGNVAVILSSPKNNSSGISGNALSLTFNQNVVHSSAEELFYLEPSVAGGFSWKNNILTYNSTGFATDSTYKFGVRSGVKSIHGLDSNKSFDFSFSTKASETILNVALDYQDKPLSCEAASLKMALRYKGAGVSEDDIMGIIGFDPTIRNGNIWGDPYNAFVGDINGRQNTTGYGVYWDPIARAANNWRRAEAFTGWSVSQVAGQIAEGNPVVIWGVTGRSIARDDWNTPSGKSILAWRGEHARTLIGFKGSVSNPTSFIINDPISGRLTWSRSQFESNWGTFGNAGVVVY